jgi:hypothetical protein
MCIVPCQREAFHDMLDARGTVRTGSISTNIIMVWCFCQYVWAARSYPPHNLLSQMHSHNRPLHRSRAQSVHSAASSILIFAIAGVQAPGGGSRAYRMSDNGKQRTGGRTVEDRVASTEAEFIWQRSFLLRRVRVVNQRSVDKPA